jgi:hypothetical protein
MTLLPDARSVFKKISLIAAGDFAEMEEKMAECWNMTDLAPLRPAKTLKATFDVRKQLGLPKPPMPAIVVKIKARILSCLEKRLEIETAVDVNTTVLAEELRNCFNISDLFILSQEASNMLMSLPAPDAPSPLPPPFIIDLKKRITECVTELKSMIAAGDFLNITARMNDCFNMTGIFPVPDDPAVKTLQQQYDARLILQALPAPAVPSPMPPPFIIELKKRITECVTELKSMIAAGDFANITARMNDCFNMTGIFPVPDDDSSAKTLQKQFDARNVLQALPAPDVPSPLPPPFIIDLKKRITECVTELNSMIAAGDFLNITARMNDCFNMTDIFSVPDDDSSAKTLQQQFDARILLQSAKTDGNKNQLTLQEAFKKPVMATLGASKSVKEASSIPKIDAFDFLIRNYFNALNNVTCLVVDAQSSVFWVALLLIVFMIGIEIYIMCIKRPDNRLYMQIPSNQDF